MAKVVWSFKNNISEIGFDFIELAGHVGYSYQLNGEYRNIIDITYKQNSTPTGPIAFFV